MPNTVAPPKSIELHWLMPAVGLVPGLSLENVVYDSAGSRKFHFELLYSICKIYNYHPT